MESYYFRLVTLLLHNLNRKYVYLIILFSIISLTKGASFGPDSTTIVVPVESENTTEATDVTPTLQSNTIMNQSFTCQNLTNYAQRTMCFNTPGLLKAILDAEKLARKECIEQFRYESWNCSGFAMTTPSNVTKHATKETAYIYALMSAALAHVVTRDCRSNGMNCSCGDNVTLPNDNSDTTVKHGCSSNIKFGLDISAAFMDGKEQPGGITRQRINLQNNLVGRTVFNNMNNQSIVHCRCIGYSASCPMKVCRFKIISFNSVAAQLKQHYNNSCKVSVRSSVLHSRCRVSSITNETLVYTISSPDYCHKNSAKGSIGVSGRECDPTKGNEKDCNRICCGRGHEEHTKRVAGLCCIMFGWKCTSCTKDITYYTCR